MPAQNEGASLPLHEALTLLSTEGMLLCSTCEAWLESCDCPTFTPVGVCSVGRILPKKLGARADSIRSAHHAGAPLPPIQVEEGHLVDGHHRLAVAHQDALDELPSQRVEGVLSQQIAWHQHLVSQRTPFR